MITIPFFDGTRLLVVLVMQQENIDRMKMADPASIPLHDEVYAPFLPLSPKDITFYVCFEEDLKPIYELQKKGNPKAVYDYLTRGWRMIGDDGTAARRVQ